MLRWRIPGARRTGGTGFRCRSGSWRRAISRTSAMRSSTPGCGISSSMEAQAVAVQDLLGGEIGGVGQPVGKLLGRCVLAGRGKRGACHLVAMGIGVAVWGVSWRPHCARLMPDPLNGEFAVPSARPAYLAAGGGFFGAVRCRRRTGGGFTGVGIRGSGAARGRSAIGRCPPAHRCSPGRRDRRLRLPRA